MIMGFLGRVSLDKVAPKHPFSSGCILLGQSPVKPAEQATDKKNKVVPAILKKSKV